MKYAVHVEFETEDGAKDFTYVPGGIEANSERKAKFKADFMLRKQFLEKKVKRIIDFIIAPYDRTEEDFENLCKEFDAIGNGIDRTANTSEDNIKEKYEDKMLAAVDNTDPESGHAACDKVLCELLTELGFDRVVRYYDFQLKWCW